MLGLIATLTVLASRSLRRVRDLADRFTDAVDRHVGQRLRPYFPESGAAYELFDQAVLLLVLGSIGYVITDPTPATLNALQAPLHFLNEKQWGFLIAVMALLGIGASYRRETLARGYLIVMCTAAFWCGNLAWGFVFADAGPRALMSAVIYGSITSRLRRVRKQELSQ